MTRRETIVLLSPSVAIVVVPLIWYVTDLSNYLLKALLLYILFMTLYGGISLLRGQWKLGGICCLPLLLALAFRFGGNQFFFVQDAGFQIMIFLRDDYSKRCNPITFSSDEATEFIGFCGRIERDFESYDYIMLDTSGQLMRPIPRRTQQWRIAAGSLPNGKVLAGIELDVRHLTGPFYVVHFRWQDEERSDY